MYKADVIERFKSAAEVARFLGISRSAVSQWPEVVPEASARKLEKLTGGELIVDEDAYLTRPAA